MTRGPAWLVLVAVTACAGARLGGGNEPGPTVTFPARFPAGDSGEPAASASAAAPPASGVASAAPRTGFPPDPQPLRLERQWEYEVVYDHGSLRVASVTERRFAQPVVTARRMGRFAIELWIGHELIERVRFDFPMLGAEEPASGPRRPLHEPPTFAPGAVVTQRVLVPASPRATRAVLLDRASGRTQVLPWPPDAPLQPPEPPSTDAGPSAEPAQPDGG